jgi:hypothetical protein
MQTSWARIAGRVIGQDRREPAHQRGAERRGVRLAAITA